MFIFRTIHHLIDAQSPLRIAESQQQKCAIKSENIKITLYFVELDSKVSNRENYSRIEKFKTSKENNITLPTP